MPEREIRPARPVKVAFTLEQCWHSSPGGTARTALKLAEEFARLPDDIDVYQVAGKHAVVPQPEFRPVGKVAMLPLARPLLYETWTRFWWPKVESVTGPIDVVHATGIIPAATSAPLVVTLHDLAFVHDPDKFSRHGVRVMTRSIDVISTRADLVICPSAATMADAIAVGLDPAKLRVVPMGVDTGVASPAAVERVRREYQLPDDFVLFVGTIEPRKNLARLIAAMRARAGTQPLVVAGAPGWGDVDIPVGADDVLFLGFVPDADLAALYGAASVFAYPSEREGFGLPVAEAMAQSTPVVTSRGTSTEEVADGAAVLVDPFDVDSIAAGIDEAYASTEVLGRAGRRRALELDWSHAANGTLAVYRELVPDLSAGPT